ncbi:MAG: TetR/AcrR family transcriptional regulator [Spirochaetes bacterium]|nr:TetR/AcrR family transcriptional regulator [Spirochaetota bacterium]
MDGKERRYSILKAATAIFSVKGFHGTSVRKIAAAANVSEALLYKHFKSKEEIYLSLREYIAIHLSTLSKHFKDREPGGRMLVELTYCLVMMILTDMPGRAGRQRSFERLLGYSLLENVNFIKHVFLNWNNELGPLWNKCSAAAIKNNEIDKNRAVKNNMWFVHHLAMIINLLHLSGSKNKLFPYEDSYEKLVEETIRFALNGLGLTESTISKYYKPYKLKKVFKGVNW